MKYVSNAKMNTSVESGTIFEGKCGLVDITIHLYRKNKFSGRGDTFYLSSNCVGISNMKLESKSIITAIQEAEIIVNKEIITMKNDTDRYIHKNPEIMIYGNDESRSNWFDKKDLANTAELIMNRYDMPISATMVRTAMAKDDRKLWMSYVNPRLHKMYDELREELMTVEFYKNLAKE